MRYLENNEYFKGFKWKRGKRIKPTQQIIDIMITDDKKNIIMIIRYYKNKKNRRYLAYSLKYNIEIEEGNFYNKKGKFVCNYKILEYSTDENYMEETLSLYNFCYPIDDIYNKLKNSIIILGL